MHYKIAVDDEPWDTNFFMHNGVYMRIISKDVKEQNHRKRIGSALAIILLFSLIISTIAVVIILKNMKSDKKIIENVLKNEHSIDVFLVDNPNIVFEEWCKSDTDFYRFVSRDSAKDSVINYINENYSEINSPEKERERDILVYLYKWLCMKK